MNPIRIVLWPYHKLNQTLVKIPFFDKLRTELKEIRKANITKTLYFNFKMFPFHIARKLPVWIYGKVKFYSLDGEIRFNCPINARIVCIGKGMEYFGARYISTININRGGIWIINGHFIANRGALINVQKGAYLSTGKNVLLGASAKIRCLEEIHIDDGVGITEECQIFDSNFHFTQNIKTGEVKRMSGKIIIGKLCWIGNRSTISKGTKLPDYSIVCSNSLVNKDFTNIKQKCPIIGGIPAKHIGSGIHRIYNENLQMYLSNIFANDPNLSSILIEPEKLDFNIDVQLRDPLFQRP